MKPTQSIAAIVGILITGSLLGWAGSQGGITLGSWPLFALCGVMAFVIQWVAFVPAYARQTEHFFDLTGSLTYGSLVLVALLLGEGGIGNLRSLLIAVLVIVWATRLGTFLRGRVQEAGSDGRFDRIKPSFSWFLMSWTLQGLWVYLTLAAALAAMTATRALPIDGWAVAGALIWVAGFALEVVADNQKRAFRKDNEGRFITTGLWAWSRHPNYFGEILLWIGIAVIAVPVLTGWQYVTLISPLFVFLLLTRVSGIPMLEARGRKRWGSDPEYQAYVSRTSALVPLPPKLAG